MAKKDGWIDRRYDVFDLAPLITSYSVEVFPPKVGEPIRPSPLAVERSRIKIDNVNIRRVNWVIINGMFLPAQNLEVEHGHPGNLAAHPRLVRQPVLSERDENRASRVSHTI